MKEKTKLQSIEDNYSKKWKKSSLFRIGTLKSVNNNVFLLFAVSFSFLILICLFSPRFALWKGLRLDVGLFNPEVNRAVDTLKQLDNPFVEIKNASNQVINWRLLFPIIAYCLNLPIAIFLLLPYVGLLFVLLFLGKLFLENFKNRIDVIGAILITASTSWFFVSSGWLTYFDSWFVLGLLIVAFIDSKFLMAATCVFTPWIDERFIFALPLCLTIRAVRQENLNRKHLKNFLIDIFICVCAIFPLFLIRLIAILIGNSRGSSKFLFQHILKGRHLPENSLTFLEGAWYGLRASWFYVIIFSVLSYKPREKIRNIFINSVLIITIITTLLIAGDLTRSISSILPAAIMGLIFSFRKFDKKSRYILWALVPIALFSPAYHVVTKFKIPIENIFEEIKREKNPPVYLTATWNRRKGELYLLQGHYFRSLKHFNAAVILNPKLGDAYFYRGIIYQKFNKILLAHQDYSTSIKIMPDNWKHRKQAEKLLKATGKVLSGK